MTVFKKSLLTLGAAALILSFVLVLIVLIFMNSLYYETSALALKNTAKTLMATIGNEKIAGVFADNSIDDIDMMIKSSDVYRLTLIEPSGYVLWDSQIPGRLVNHIDREEIKAALEGREASARRDSLSTNMKQIYYAMPVFGNDNNIIGVFRLSISVPEFWARVSPIIYPFLLFSFIAVGTAFLIIYVFSRSLSSSICRLVDITQTGASLLSGAEADEKIAPEFKSLEKAIRAMTFELNFQLERAKTERQRLEAILNGMSEAVFAADSELKLHLVNPRARELFNIESRNDTATLLEATRSAELTEAAKKALASGTASEMELTLRSGAEQQFHVFVSPLAGRSGVVIVLLEITQIVKLERIRKDFVANVSHELRTPIQLIKGFSETLLDTLSDGENSSRKQLIHFIEIINKNAGTMENLTNDLLILADLENDSRNARDPEELSIAQLIGEAVSSVEVQAKRKKIEIKTDCPGNLKYSLYGSFIVQALINLIDNAIKYSPPESKVWITAQDSNGELVLQVRDKGIGIPSEHLERIFERFYRVDRSRSREAGGTGLGLSIVRHIALIHKGKAEAESHAGEGSVFRMIIPDQNRIHH
ncbi:MAG: ATP-binding protein [Brevinematales bacterium]|nr:ATP-binding protein [Brevinematales bacterium]